MSLHTGRSAEGGGNAVLLSPSLFQTDTRTPVTNQQQQTYSQWLLGVSLGRRVVTRTELVKR